MKIKIGLLSLVLLFCGCPNNQAYTYAANKLRPLSINGIVIGKVDLQQTEPCFGDIIIKSGNKIDTINICHCSVGNNIWEFTSLGDSIIKPNGSINFKIHQAKTGSNKTFEYPNCFY